MVVEIIISGGAVVTATEKADASIAINDGNIIGFGTDETLPNATETIDASGLLVIPGVIDPHVHIDEMFSIDSYESATGAAAVGGTTTYIDFAR